MDFWPSASHVQFAMLVELPFHQGGLAVGMETLACWSGDQK
jgi:hypothetical protein